MTLPQNEMKLFAKKHLTIRKLNDFNAARLLCPCHWLDRAPKIQKIFREMGYTFLPIEMWEMILTSLMYLEKRENSDYHRWLYSDWNRESFEGMTLRSRKLYLPNTIMGIVVNEGIYITNFEPCAYSPYWEPVVNEGIYITNLERCAYSPYWEPPGKKNDEFSQKYLKYIIRWYHWLVESSVFNASIWHLVLTIQQKTNELFEAFSRYPDSDTYNNFMIACNYINVYYPNFEDDCMNYHDIEFETFIFNKEYYKKVYCKAMRLRNGKRINLFLHE